MVDNQDEFVSELLEISSNNTSSSNTLYTRDNYTQLLEDVKQAKEKQRADNTMAKEKEQKDKHVASVVLLLLQTWSYVL